MISVVNTWEELKAMGAFMMPQASFWDDLMESGNTIRKESTLGKRTKMAASTTPQEEL